MPVRKGSIDGKYNKILSEISYIGRNFWRFLPIGNEITIYNGINEDEQLLTSSDIKNIKETTSNRGIYSLIWVFGTLIWFQNGINNGTWTPNQIIEYSKKEKENLILKTEKKKIIEKNLFSHSSLFRHTDYQYWKIHTHTDYVPS